MINKELILEIVSSNNDFYGHNIQFDDKELDLYKEYQNIEWTSPFGAQSTKTYVDGYNPHIGEFVKIDIVGYLEGHSTEEPRVNDAGKALSSIEYLSSYLFFVITTEGSDSTNGEGIDMDSCKIMMNPKFDSSVKYVKVKGTILSNNGGMRVQMCCNGEIHFQPSGGFGINFKTHFPEIHMKMETWAEIKNRKHDDIDSWPFHDWEEFHKFFPLESDTHVEQITGDDEC